MLRNRRAPDRPPFGVVVLGAFAVVAGCMGKMFRRFPVMVSSFLRHGDGGVSLSRPAADVHTGRRTQSDLLSITVVARRAISASRSRMTFPSVLLRPMTPSLTMLRSRDVLGMPIGLEIGVDLAVDREHGGCPFIRPGFDRIEIGERSQSPGAESRPRRRYQSALSKCLPIAADVTPAEHGPIRTIESFPVWKHSPCHLLREGLAMKRRQRQDTLY
jgi:hypothetical protein